MALTYLSATISNPSNGRSTDHRLLVDSGATYSIVPSSVLKRLHIGSIDTQKFILANGEEITREIGEARFAVMGKKRIAPVVFGNENVWVLGATTLESLGFVLDPINRKLLSLPMTL